MIKKSYRALSLADAVLKIKRDMGPKAVIISTQHHPERKTFFKTTPAQIEVIAAVAAVFAGAGGDRTIGLGAHGRRDVRFGGQPRGRAGNRRSATRFSIALLVHALLLHVRSLLVR